MNIMQMQALITSVYTVWHLVKNVLDPHIYSVKIANLAIIIMLPLLLVMLIVLRDIIMIPVEIVWAALHLAKIVDRLAQTVNLVMQVMGLDLILIINYV